MELRNTRFWTVILVLVLLYLVTAYYSAKYSDQIRIFLGEQTSIGAAIIYLFVSILSIVVAPIASLPFLPILANLWGSFWAGLISIIGWTLGNIIAFVLARRYGRPLFKKLGGSERDISQIRGYLPRKEDNLFLYLVLLRIIFPFDILSHALGLLAPDIKIRTFTLSTIVAIAPSALLFSYAGTASVVFQIILFIIAFFIFYFGSKYLKHRHHGKVA